MMNNQLCNLSRRQFSVPALQGLSLYMYYVSTVHLIPYLLQASQINFRGQGRQTGFCIIPETTSLTAFPQSQYTTVLLFTQQLSRSFAFVLDFRLILLQFWLSPWNKITNKTIQQQKQKHLS